MGAGKWPEIILVMVRMVQSAQKDSEYFFLEGKEISQVGGFFGCTYVLS